ncbi:hypothetical protein V8E53_006750 [Lactarius tabidus]
MSYTYVFLIKNDLYPRRMIAALQGRLRQRIRPTATSRRTFGHAFTSKLLGFGSHDDAGERSVCFAFGIFRPIALCLVLGLEPLHHSYLFNWFVFCFAVFVSISLSCLYHTSCHQFLSVCLCPL